MIDIVEVIEIHDKLIELYGGTKGVRDLNLLKSSLNRPFVTFDSEELYKTPIEKASATLESMVKNHPFIDGNKRIGYFLCRAILLDNNLDIKANEDEKYIFVISIAKGENFEYIKYWLNKNVYKV